MIVCCGEALIDLLPRETKDGALAYQPFAGGSIFNTAIALGRLGLPTGFFGGLSSDLFGDQLREALLAAQVDISFSPPSPHPSTLAFVKLVDRQARYSFFDEGSAGRLLAQADLPKLGDSVAALHFGAISLIPEPGGGTFEALLHREEARRVISLDPNIRPGFIKDAKAHKARIARMAAKADILKMSDEDSEWLLPGAPPETAAQHWIKEGAKIVAFTRGAKGAVAFTRDVAVAIPAVTVTVADTVGAGDTFAAGILAALHKAGLMSKAALPSVSDSRLREALSFAAKAAAVTVSRPGADPPWASEMG